MSGPDRNCLLFFFMLLAQVSFQGSNGPCRWWEVSLPLLYLHLTCSLRLSPPKYFVLECLRQATAKYDEGQVPYATETHENKSNGTVSCEAVGRFCLFDSFYFIPLQTVSLQSSFYHHLTYGICLDLYSNRPFFSIALFYRDVMVRGLIHFFLPV